MPDEIIDRIEKKIAIDGEFDLLHIDQMNLIKSGIDLQAICTEKGWHAEPDRSGMTTKIQKISEVIGKSKAEGYDVNQLTAGIF